MKLSTVVTFLIVVFTSATYRTFGMEAGLLVSAVVGVASVACWCVIAKLQGRN